MSKVEFPKEWLDTVLMEDNRQVLKRMPAECVGLTITSPPYYNYRPYMNWTTYEDYLATVKEWMVELFRVTRPGRRLVWNTCVIAHPDGYDKGLLPIPYDCVRIALDAGWLFSQEIFWDDPAGKSRWPVGSFPHSPTVLMRRSVEHLSVFRKPRANEIKPSYHTEKLPEELKPFNLMDAAFFRDRVAKQVWVIPPRNGSDGHSAAYPEELVEPCIRMWSRPGEVVFDPFMGTGTTAISALTWKRHYFGCEWTEDYYRMAKNNIATRIAQIRNEELAATLFPEAWSKSTYVEEVEVQMELEETKVEANKSVEAGK